MRTQGNKEKYKEYDHKYYIKNKRPKTKIGQAEAEIDQLKQQLAEKDKEIEVMDKDLVFNANEIKRLIQEKKQLKQNQTQLAIQELEKVKELLLIESKNNPIVYDVNDDTVGGALDRDKTFEIIDQQIKELKGE